MNSYQKKYRVPFRERIVAMLLPFPERESVTGDMAEMHEEIVQARGRHAASVWYWLQIFRLLPGTLESTIYWSFAMIRHYVKTALRSVRRSPGYSLINVFGLALGLAVCMLILLFVADELSYDRFHEHGDRIYRIHARGLIGNTEIHQTGTPAIMPRTLKADFPEVEETLQIRGRYSRVVRYEEKSLPVDNILGVDSTFFQIFTVPLLSGTPESVLRKPNSVVLTQTTARRIFGNTDPIGKALDIENLGIFTVTGLSTDMPHNSHFDYDMLFSMHSFPEWTDNPGWFSNNYATYVLLRDGVSWQNLEEKLPDFFMRHVGVGDQGETSDDYWEWYLMPLHDIHLKSHVSGEFKANGSIEIVYIFVTIALFVLLIACINFMNLSTARSAKRAREIGIRKVLGSTRGQLVRQFFGETAVMCVIALVLAVIMVAAALPWFREFAGKEIAFAALAGPYALGGMVLLTIVVAAVAGSYPALFLSSFQPVKILKGFKQRESGRQTGFRGALVVLQFSITIFLIAGTFIVYDQLRYVQSSNLGFDKEQVLLIKQPYNLGDGLDAFKERLNRLSTVKSVSYSSTVPGKGFNNWGIGAEGKQITLNAFVVDEDFAETYRLEVVEGRFLSEKFTSDSTALVLNQAAVDILEWENSLNRNFQLWNEIPMSSIGVVKDFHYESMRTKVRAAALFSSKGYPGFRPSYASVRIDGADVPGTVSGIQDIWKEMSGGLPFEYGFFDEEYGRLYSNEMQMGRVLTVFAALSIAIACLGLFGLASYSAAQRTREIGIRKTLGASAGNIYGLLLREFLKWVILANVIAWPATWIVMSRWLESYAYRIEISLFVFLAAGLAALAIALLTVSKQALSASYANIVDALKYE